MGMTEWMLKTEDLGKVKNERFVAKKKKQKNIEDGACKIGR